MADRGELSEAVESMLTTHFALDADAHTDVVETVVDVVMAAGWRSWVRLGWVRASDRTEHKVKIIAAGRGDDIRFLKYPLRNPGATDD